MKEMHNLVLDLTIDDNEYEFATSIEDALITAEQEKLELSDQIKETEELIKKLTPECDKLDYILAASSGALCGIMDIFLVGKPGKSPVGDITDKWFEERTKDFAKLCKWDDSKDNSLKSALLHLEDKYRVPYDQRGAGDAASKIFDITPSNHHFKSLAHNPTLLGLFFSILDQFSEPTTSHFVTGGELISLQDADNKYKLRGHDVPSKLFCAFLNWIGHLISDMSGSSSSKDRGMGIPSPIWSWSNDVIALKSTLGIPVTQFDNNVNELALKIYEEGYDARFQAAQAIPVLVNEMLVRTIYAIRRLLQYYACSEGERSLSALWKSCEPFSNASVKRMLTVAHGSFCLVDAGDAVIRGFATGAGSFNVQECFLRLNLIGIGRLGISLYGEVRRGSQKGTADTDLYFLTRKRLIVEDYIDGLNILADAYDDKYLLTFTDDLKNSDMYKSAFEKSILLAEKRNVPQNEILKSKSDIDTYFQ